MSIRDEIREILAEGRTRTAAQLAEALGRPVIVVAQQLGGMGAARNGDGPGALWSLPADAVPRVRRARAAAPAQPVEEPVEEPVAESADAQFDFDACVYLNGTVVIYGALRVGDTVQLTPDQVQQLRALLDRMGPV
jgi:hypothetical protein